MKRVLNLSIPYKCVKFYAQISSTKEMSPFQKYLMALIISSENSDWANLTLQEAITNKLGVYESNLNLVEDEIKELAKHNFQKSRAELLSEIVAILNYEIGTKPKLKQRILKDSKYVLFLGQKNEIVNDFLFPFFKGLKIQYSTKNVIEPPSYTLNENKLETSFSKVAFINIFEEQIEKNLSASEEIEKMEIKEEQIVFANHLMELQFEDGIIITNEIDYEIINKINRGVLEINLENYINDEIKKLNLTRLRKDVKVEKILFNKRTLHSHDLFATKFNFDGDNLNLYYYDIEEFSHQGKSYEVMVIFKEERVWENVIDLIAKEIDESLFLLLSKFKRKQVIMKRLSKGCEVFNYMENLIDYSLYQNLDEKGKITFLTKNKIVANNFLQKFYHQFNANDIFEYQKITKLDKMKTITFFDYQYKLGQTLFEEWHSEQTFFSTIEMIFAYQRNHKTQAEIDQFIKVSQAKVKKEFYNHPLWKQAIAFLNKIRAEVILINEAKAIKKQMEDELNKLDLKPIEFIKKTLENLDGKQAQKLNYDYRFLTKFINSNDQILNQKGQIKAIENRFKIILPLKKKVGK